MGDTEFAEWVRANQNRLTRSAYLLTGDLQRAEDLAQEAMVKVGLRWSRLRDSHPTAYARTIIVRDNVSWWRRFRETTVATLPDVPADLAETETTLVIHQSLARLTARQRAVLVLRYFDDLTERETAEILGVTVGTVKSTHAAALGRLRQVAPELDDLIGGPR
ncbi:SigE family RNA polymerase sigma factor [Nocardioides sp. SYSU DS0663]|uniref:SigE family RNA polymerase sigma factor n=1 Tax=Nocardioides sp. SYSU DS0663 TaxID=3416445 RepID=UPI003F4C30E8